MKPAISMCGQSIGHLGRLEALEQTRLLDSLEEETFDRFTRLTATLLGVKVSLVSLVARDRQFFKSQVGLSEPFASSRETDISHSFCRFVVEGGQPFVVEDARTDSRVSSNPAVQALGVVAYLGMPLATRDGHILGSLCAIEGHPRKWKQEDQDALADLAGAVMREIELTESADALRDALMTFEAEEKTRERELRMMAHDLRTPAGAICSCLEMLSMDGIPFTEEQEELLQLSRESVERLLLMIQSMLEIGRLKSRGETPLKVRPISASFLLRKVMRVIRPCADEAAVSLSCTFPDQLIYLDVDEQLMERVMLNLLTNAVKYSPSHGTITISIESCEHKGRPMCLLAVSDQGPGVPDEEKEKIFDQFVTGSLPSERGMDSFGIGLAFCRSVIRSHQGEIGVRDAPGSGSIFYCLLPIGTSPETVFL